MMSVKTAMHTRTLTPASADGMAFTTTRSAALRKQVGIVASRALTITTGLLRALVGYGNPSSWSEGDRFSSGWGEASSASRTPSGQSRNGSRTHED